MSFKKYFQFVLFLKGRLMRKQIFFYFFFQVKVTCNFWEVAGGVKFSAVIPQLIYTPLKERRWLPSVTIVVDLTRPSQIYITLDKFMKVLKDCLTNYSEKYPDHYQTIFQKRKADWKAIHPNHSVETAIAICCSLSHLLHYYPYKKGFSCFLFSGCRCN